MITKEMSPKNFDSAFIKRSEINSSFIFVEVYKNDKCHILFMLDEGKNVERIHFLKSTNVPSQTIILDRLSEEEKEKYLNFFSSVTKHFNLRLKVITI